MQSVIGQQKTLLRVDVRKQMEDMSIREMRESDELLFRRFLDLPQVAQAKTILLFWGVTGFELDTARLVDPLYEMGKLVCMPRTLPERQMETRLYRTGDPFDTSSFGVLEPGLSCPLVEKQDIDLALIPAMCYDRRGYRLGFGGGYYDRWLATFQGKTVGLCREALLRDEIPVEEHDRPVQLLLTEHIAQTFDTV